MLLWRCRMEQELSWLRNTFRWRSPIFYLVGFGFDAIFLLIWSGVWRRWRTAICWGETEVGELWAASEDEYSVALRGKATADLDLRVESEKALAGGKAGV